jgi:Flp pilus assembly protein TadD
VPQPMILYGDLLSRLFKGLMAIEWASRGSARTARSVVCAVIRAAGCLVVCMLACASCTRQLQTTQIAMPYPAVPAAMAREVKGAADAGEGDLELRTLRQRLAANAKDLDARLALAHYYADRNLPDLALEHYRLAATQFPDSVPVTLSLAKTLREMGEPGEALKTLRELADRQPRGSWEVLSLEGILEDERGQLAEAEKSDRAALAIAPAQSSLHNNLGYNLLSQKKTDAAIAEFRRAIELDPKSQIAHNNLAGALSRSASGSQEALAEWARSGNPAVAHNNLAAALIEQGRYPEARAELNAALALQPNLSSALDNLRLLSEKDGKPATVAAKRRVSVWGKLLGRKSAPQAGAPPADTSADTTADTTVKK